MLDSPGTAAGAVDTVADVGEAAPAVAAAVAAPVADSAEEPVDTSTDAVLDVVAVDEQVAPAIAELASRADEWAEAREQAVANGDVEVRSPTPEQPDFETLLTIAPETTTSSTTTSTTTTTAPPTTTTPSTTTTAAPEQKVEEPPIAPALGTGVGDGDDGEAADAEDVEEVAEEVVEEIVEEVAEQVGPVVPVQVNGRVPVPEGGPTAEQWDAVRFCESTHNYQAVNPSGKFRGAYQFSRQTWDWVAGIHHPHLVGVDPAAAEPGWQDVMAYELFDLLGWNQWPECGVHLL